MSYKVFLSHSEIDAPIAKAVAKVISDAFAGDIVIYLALENVVGGAAWKNELIENLERCDAIITILTQESISKPWIYVEWSPFWLKNKIYYTLITDEISNISLINPMIDRQVVCLSKTDDIRMFFKALSNDSQTNTSAIWAYIDEFIIAVEKGLNEKLEEEYGAYKRSDKELPEDDYEKRKIANFFFKKGDYSNYVRFTKLIRDDWVKVNIILNLFKDSRISHQEELSMTLEISSSINRGGYIADIVKEIINLGNLDSKAAFELVELVSKSSQEGLELIAKHLIDHNYEDSNLFGFVIKKTTSQAHLRNVLKHAIGQEKHENDFFDTLIEQFNSSSELKNVALELIGTNSYCSNCLDKIVVKIIQRGNFTNYLKTILSSLAAKDITFVNSFYDRLSEQFIVLKTKEIQFYIK